MSNTYDDYTDKSEPLSVMEETIYLIKNLSDDDVKIINGIVKRFNKPVIPLSEDKIFDRIKRSMSQIEAGEYIDSEELEQDLISKYGLFQKVQT